MGNHKNHRMERIGVVGAGSWGTALAHLLGLKGFAVDLWAYEEAVKQQIESEHHNDLFLPGVSLSDNISPTNDIEKVVSEKSMVIVVVPSHVMRETVQKMSNCLHPAAVLVSASKGIENGTRLTMTGIFREVLSGIPDTQFTVLSGPSFAKEVAQRVPTVMTVASSDPQSAQFVQNTFATDYFRVYTHDDVIGVELGGAVKNVIAIAAGMIDGLGLGLNTRAALITRGMAEIRRLGVRLGANPRTFTSSAGIGDLILTCTGTLSRNHTIGRQIGQGLTIDQIISKMHMVAEGVRTSKSVYNLSNRLNVEMPICHAIYHILYEGLAPQKALSELMTRDLKQELDLY
jgi:glycerol-3-phosphate dehydrogenase (NAD(P)+)